MTETNAERSDRTVLERHILSLAKLNEFLQGRVKGRWGDSVVHIAMDLIVEQEEELESLRNEITVTKYTKGRPSVIDWNGERWIYDPQTTFKGGAPGGKSKATQPHRKSETI